MSKSDNTNGLDIRFNVGRKNYRLRSISYDFCLEEIKIGKTEKTEGKEVFELIGYGSTLEQIFYYLYKEHQLRNSEIYEVKQLVDELAIVLKSIHEQTSNITFECFIKPEERKSLVSKLRKYEEEIERLKKENQSLRAKIRTK